MRNVANACLGPSEIIDSDDDNSELGDIQAPLSVTTGVFCRDVSISCGRQSLGRDAPRCRQSVPAGRRDGLLRLLRT